MTQPSLLDLPTPRQKKRGHVPASSVAAYREQPRNKRVADVTMWLLAFVCAWEDWPTSAELHHAYGRMDLYTTRRALSDALSLGLVSHAGERKCAVSGRTCLTWRVVGR